VQDHAKLLDPTEAHINQIVSINQSIILIQVKPIKHMNKRHTTDRTYPTDEVKLEENNPFQTEFRTDSIRQNLS